jgi:hypothetical protein
MAHREPRQPTALQVRVTFEPHRRTPDCVAHAYEHIVPWPRRMVARTASAAQREAGHTQQEQIGRRNVS